MISRMWPMDMLLLPIFCFLAVLIFIVLAFRGWVKTDRIELPRWRSRIGVTSMLVVSTIWLFVILLVVFGTLDTRWTNFFDSTWLGCLFFAALAAAFLALLLKGATRLQGIAAALLMAAFWMTIIVH
jgi:hypothetical protein